MKTRILGNSRLTVSAIGLVCVGMSEFYGKSDDDQSLDLLHQAIDLGINFLDQCAGRKIHPFDFPG